jgi:type IV secretory pathway component VirB8
VNQTDFKAEFESLGADRVQKFVEASVWSEDKLRAARIWLDRESNRTARSAKNAAWAAAIAATVAAICAIIAIVLDLLRH